MRTERTKERAAEAAVKVTGTRWCSNHAGYAPEAGGTWRVGAKTKRFICASCRVPKVAK